MIQIALAAANGSQLRVDNGHRVVANREDIGPWETFRLFNRSRPDSDPSHGDLVVLQAWTGRYLTAVGGGGGVVHAEQHWIDTATIFTIEKLEGTGVVGSDTHIALRAANGNYVVAENGGGSVVNANRPHRGAWETFTIKLLRPQLIRLRASSGRYVTAENGGERGAVVTANREGPGLWETFSIVNHSRSDRNLRNGDTVALQAWSGLFLRLTASGGVDIGASRTSDDALFTVSTPSGDGIEHNQHVSFRSRQNSRYLGTNAGIIVADRTAPAGDALFTLELAERSGIGMGMVPDGSALPNRPFAAPVTPVTGNRKLLVLHVDDEANPPLALSNDQIASNLFGQPPSLAEWYRAMSGGTFTVSSAGVFGPIRISSTFSPDQILTAAEQQGVPLASFAREGVIRDTDTLLVRIGVGPSGQTGYFDAVSAAGIRYRGKSPGAGVDPTLSEPTRGVIGHETSHALLDVLDRYGERRPIRGDVVARFQSAGTQEQFVVERIAGPGAVRSGDRVMLRAYDGKYLAVGSSPPDLFPSFINTESAAAGDARHFVMAKVTGVAEIISSGDKVVLRSNAGRFMTAERGGNSSVTANRTEARSWEQFELARIAGTGPVNSGDTVTLKTSEAFYLRAESNGRDRAAPPEALQRGYYWGSGVGSGGAFDQSSDNYRIVMLSLYDRIRAGWARPRYLTPDNRGCYVIRPYIDSQDALILFDPHNPSEWYTVENRQRRENIDEVPSSGIVISWVCQDEGYWQWWFASRNDPQWPVQITRWPSVISAAASSVPPNDMALPALLNQDLVRKRNHSNAAFTNQEVVLPRGNGDPSRFQVSFHTMSGGSIAMCLR